MKKSIFYLFLLVSVYAYATEEGSSLGVVEQVEKNLIYSKEVIKPEKSDIIIKKGGWDEDDTKKIEEALNREPVEVDVVAEHTYAKRVEKIIADYEEKINKK